MVMSTRYLEHYVQPLLDNEFDHIQNVRFGTKALTFWPYRFVEDRDADELLRLFERLIAKGKHVALMAHYNHPRELETSIARRAISRIRDTGAVIRSQGPLLANINDRSEIWSKLWQDQVSLGIIPYYMFVERDTGARRYFEIPLARAHAIYKGAIQNVSGLARTARGPSMSAGPGKIEIQGTAQIAGHKVFVTSPYCRLVRERLCELELPYLVHNVARGSDKRAAFVERSGRMMVPYLIDPNTSIEMFESADIVAYLEESYGR